MEREKIEKFQIKKYKISLFPKINHTDTAGLPYQSMFSWHSSSTLGCFDNSYQMPNLYRYFQAYF